MEHYEGVAPLELEERTGGSQTANGKAHLLVIGFGGLVCSVIKDGLLCIGPTANNLPRPGQQTKGWCSDTASLPAQGNKASNQDSVSRGSPTWVTTLAVVDWPATGC